LEKNKSIKAAISQQLEVNVPQKRLGTGNSPLKSLLASRFNAISDSWLWSFPVSNISKGLDES